MFILKKGHQPGVYVPLRALFLVCHAAAQYAPCRQITYLRVFQSRVIKFGSYRLMVLY